MKHILVIVSFLLYAVLPAAVIADDIELRLKTNDGTSRFSVQNKNTVEVLGVDSQGYMYLKPVIVTGTPSAGTIAVDSTGSLNKLKWYDGTTWRSVGSTEVDNITLEYFGTTLRVKPNSISSTEIGSSNVPSSAQVLSYDSATGRLKWIDTTGLGTITGVLPGAGMAGGGTNAIVTLEAKYDNITIGLNAITGSLEVKDGSITITKIVTGAAVTSIASFGVSASQRLSGEVNVKAGQNIIVSQDAASNSITIASTGGGGSGITNAPTYEVLFGSDTGVVTSSANMKFALNQMLQIESPFSMVNVITHGDNPSSVKALLTLARTRGSSESLVAVSQGDSLGQINLSGHDGTSYAAAAEILSQAAEDFQADQYGGHLMFKTTPIGTSSPTEKMRITASGNVGIGTSYPSATLEVIGTVKATTFEGDGRLLTGVVAEGGPYATLSDYNVHVTATATHGVISNIVGTSDVQTLSSKTLEANTTIFKDKDANKYMKFQLSSILAETTKTLIVRDLDGTIALMSDVNGAAGGDLTGYYPTPTIGAGKVTQAKIATGAVTTGAIAAAAVTMAKLATGVASSLATAGTLVSRDANRGFSAGLGSFEAVKVTGLATFDLNVKIGTKGASIDAATATFYGTFDGDGSKLRKLSAAAINAAGANSQIQFNQSGTLGASSTLVFKNEKMGIGTSEPQTPLVVQYDSQYAYTNTALYNPNTYDSIWSGIVLSFRANILGTPDGSFREVAAVKAITPKHNYGERNTDLVFETDSVLTGQTHKMIITGSGNVGIGTSEPAAKLDVSGNMKMSGSIEMVSDLGSPARLLRWPSKTYAAAPSLGTRSSGTRIVLYDQISAESTDYGLGIEGGSMWFSVPKPEDSGDGFSFKYYGGNKEIMKLLGTGTLETAGGIQANGNIDLMGKSAKWLKWPNETVVAPPSYGVRSIGTKIVLYDEIVAGLGRSDYAIGIDAGVLWFSTPQASHFIKFYAGVTEEASITHGQFAVKGRVSAESLTLTVPDTGVGGGYALKIGTNGIVYKDTSSMRYKNNIATMETGFSGILDVIPKTFTYKSTGQKDFGVIAEELDSLGLKDLVVYNSAGQPDAVKYDKVSLFLLEVVKAQQAKIDVLTQQNDGYAARMKVVEERLGIK